MITLGAVIRSFLKLDSPELEIFENARDMSIRVECKVPLSMQQRRLIEDFACREGYRCQINAPQKKHVMGKRMRLHLMHGGVM